MTRSASVLAFTLVTLVILSGAAAEAAGEPCGAGAGNACATDEFCKFRPGECGTSGIQGVCTPRPQDCPAIYDPVCGCDGVTYGNECEADAAGASIASDGTCTPEVCGGIAGIPCHDPDDFCVFPDGSCIAFDQSGVCTSVPQDCPAVFDPVCGCDGVTYGNRCEALRAGAQVDYPGECPQVCGGLSGITCDDGEFCRLPPGQCDVADLEGVCRPIPDACPEVYDPVCGCDGVTYDNACFANAAAAQIDHEGACEPQVCGGIAGIPCDEGEFCKLPAGECDTADLQGVCQPIPQACPLFYDPVCGCDGVTYGNECEADAAGAQIDHPGECEQVCGGIAGIPCDEGEYCMFPDGTCDIADNQGVCRPIPQGCPDVWLPVCGCDGVTYGNRCEAAAAQAQIASEGECPPQVCGGIAGIPCDEGEFCKLPAGECDTADLQGVCQPIPQACPLFYDPVCGCDGVTYGNECEADAAGAQIDHPGECEQVCGGIAGIPCDEGEYCMFPDGTCDISDNQGVCRPIPDACPDVWDPVCGCDGMTYGNRCEAAAAGVSIESEGECVQVCGGIAGIPCDEGEFCKLPAGECDTADLQGVCQPIPQACPLFYDPVCGCDGVTYNNGCDADRAGAQIDHPGPCEQTCGGIGGVECNSDEFCLLPDGTCDHADVQGECVPVPQACPEIYDPVCGCDGQTYGNRCEAIAAGVQVDHEGECDRVCGGIAGIPCDDGEYCQFPIGTCDIVDNQGVCRPIPDACPDVWDPVCGCDGVTYGNRCEAAAAQAQIASEGECEKICGGFIGLSCDEGEYCMYPNGTCNFADHYGVCVPIPEECPEVCHPVCGCDGDTYGNLCLAQQAQVSLDHRGECDAAGRLIHKVLFDSPERMRWQPSIAAMGYNVYVNVHETPPPTSAGECFLSGIPVPLALVAPVPEEGTVWLLQVTGVYAEGEGPMGISSDCTARQPESACDSQ